MKFLLGKKGLDPKINVPSQSFCSLAVIILAYVAKFDKAMQHFVIMARLQKINWYFYYLLRTNKELFKFQILKQNLTKFRDQKYIYIYYYYFFKDFLQSQMGGIDKTIILIYSYEFIIFQMLRNGAWDQCMSALEPPVKDKLSKYQV